MPYNCKIKWLSASLNKTFPFLYFPFIGKYNFSCSLLCLHKVKNCLENIQYIWSPYLTVHGTGIRKVLRKCLEQQEDASFLSNDTSLI